MPPKDKPLIGPDFLNIFENSLVQRKVSIIEFAESPHFCNKKLYPRQKTLMKMIFLEDLDDYDNQVLDEWIESTNTGGEVTICPNVRERIASLRADGYDHFRRIILVGGRRSGKGHLTGLALAYKVYNLTLIDNVGNYFGIDEDKSLYLSIVAASLDQAKQFQFADANAWLESCKPLIENGFLNKQLAESTSIYTPFDKQKLLKFESQFGQVEKDLAKLRVQAYGSNARTIRGQAAIGFVFDELAHVAPGESHLSDKELFKAATPTLQQFGKNALVFCNSSPWQKNGQLYELYLDSMKLDPPDVGQPVYKDMFMLQYPSWELYKDYETHPFFKNHRPPAQPPEVDPIMKMEEDANPESFRVEYRSHFAEVVNAFLDPLMVDRMFDPEFTKSKIGRHINTTWGATGYMLYVGHGDPSSTGANFGIAIAHTEEVAEEIQINENEMAIMKVPHVVFDLIHAFYPEDFPEHTIDWLEVLPTIKQLINAFRPQQFTFDQFNSLLPIQKLQSDLAQMGIMETSIFVKTATAPSNFRTAMNFKAALNLGRIHAPHPSYPVKQQNEKSLELGRVELKSLQEKNGKVEKQDIGPCRTKDIADCIFACVDFLLGDITINQALNMARPEFGGFQGYGMGKEQGESPFADYYKKRSYEDVRSTVSGGRFFNRRRGQRY